VAALVVACTGIGGAVEVAASGLVAGPAAADPIGDCSTTSGVIVAVDFGPWGGDVQRGCDATLTTGYAALQAAGFTTAGDDHDGPAFICRIDDDPPPSQDPCVATPPVAASWYYWHADAGQDAWSFSQLGATSYQPPPGSVDAWVFGGPNSPPSFSPATVRATEAGPAGSVSVPTAPSATSPPATTPPTGATPAATPGGSGSSATGLATSPAAGSSGPGSKAPAAATVTAPPGSVPTTAPSGSTTPGAAGGASSGEPSSGRAATDGRSVHKIVDASPAAAKGPPPGSPLPFVIGAIAVVVLAGAGGAIAWRRRRAGQVGAR
jgi:hypothetical protein